MSAFFYRRNNMIQNNRKSLIPFFIGAVAGALVFIIIFGASVIVLPR